MESASPHLDEDRRPRAGESSRSWHAEALIQLLILAVGIALGVIYLRHEFANRFSIHGDVAQHAYWMVTYHQPDLFPNDLYVKLRTEPDNAGARSDLLGGNPVRHAGPRVGKTLIAVTLFGITGWLYYRIGRSFHGRSTGYLVAFIWLVFPNHIGEIDGGLHRSFMHPLLAAVAYALCTRKIKLVGWLLAVGLFVYPPAALVSGDAGDLRRCWSHRRSGCSTGGAGGWRAGGCWWWRRSCSGCRAGMRCRTSWGRW